MRVAVAFVALITFLSPVRADFGACCWADSQCFGPIDRLSCKVEFQGQYQGDGTSCNDVNCSGCPAGCDDNNDCTDDACDSKTGTCVFTDRIGACDDFDACTEVDECVEGMCIGSPLACDDGNACNGLETCDGLCIAGDPVVCDSPPICRSSLGASCDPQTGQCSYPPVSNGTSCSDGNACNGLETCDGGQCVAGQPITCDDPPPCQTALGASCDPQTGQCNYPITPNGTSCSDGNACNGLETCVNGACTVGEPVTCDNPPICRSSLGASCDPQTGQCNYPITPNGTSCSDGNACNGLETCVNGACTAGEPVTCDNAPPCRTALGASCDPQTGQCNYPITPNGTSCSDGNACNGLETCVNGACTAGEPVICDNPPICRSTLGASCDPQTGQCNYPLVSNGTSCSDGNACDGLEICVNGACTAGEPVICDNPPPCRTVLGASCDPQTGFCDYPLSSDGSQCEDFDVCTIREACYSGECFGVANPNCGFWKEFANCLAGPGVQVSAFCGEFDSNGDRVLDLSDVAAYLAGL